MTIQSIGQFNLRKNALTDDGNNLKIISKYSLVAKLKMILLYEADIFYLL